MICIGLCLPQRPESALHLPDTVHKFSESHERVIKQGPVKNHWSSREKEQFRALRRDSSFATVLVFHCCYNKAY